jgi:dihydroorotate dehydrogenase
VASRDELMDEVAKEGKTWAQVSKEAVERQSLKEPPPETRDVRQLVREAEELNVLLEKLGDKRGFVE